MWLSRLRNQVPGPRYRRQRLNLEKLEDRTLPSNYTAASVSDLIADINAANAAGGSNTIVLAANTTFDLTAVNNTTNGANGLPVIANKDNLTISGQGGDILQRDPAAPAFRLFDVASKASLTLTNLTLQNGLAFGSGNSAEGGAIYNQGTLALNGATTQNNVARGSSGSYDFHGNHGSTKGQDAAGGGIWSSGNLTLTNGSAVQSNQAVGGSGGFGTTGTGGNAWGGGLYIAGGTANLTGGTLNNNSAYGGAGGAISGLSLMTSYAGNGGSASGGGLFVAGGSVTLASDLLENNIAGGGIGVVVGSGFGGALYANSGTTVTLCSDTVEFNAASTSGGGIYIAPKTAAYLDSFTVANTINNTDSSGTNGSTANIDGSYILKNC